MLQRVTGAPTGIQHGDRPQPRCQLHGSAGDGVPVLVGRAPPTIADRHRLLVRQRAGDQPYRVATPVDAACLLLLGRRHVLDQHSGDGVEGLTIRLLDRARSWTDPEREIGVLRAEVRRTR